VVCLAALHLYRDELTTCVNRWCISAIRTEWQNKRERAEQALGRCIHCLESLKMHRASSAKPRKQRAALQPEVREALRELEAMQRNKHMQSRATASTSARSPGSQQDTQTVLSTPVDSSFLPFNQWRLHQQIQFTTVSAVGVAAPSKLPKLVSRPSSVQAVRRLRTPNSLARPVRQLVVT